MQVRHAVILAVTCLSLSPAQLIPPDASGIAMGHIHLNVTDVDAQIKFWRQFDAKPIANQNLPGVEVPGMLILFNKAAPTHVSGKTVLDHFGFKVRSRDEMLKSLREAGYTIGRIFTGSEGFPNAYVTGPDGVYVEMQEDVSLKVRAVAQHLHFLLPDPLPLRAWYIEKLGMQSTTRGPHQSADIPGINLTFAASTARTLGTEGGVIDHIGFEVRDLPAWCKRLGLTLIPAGPAGFSAAFLTDPKGVRIELTEGLSSYQ